MKLRALSLSLALAAFVPACTDDVDPPADTDTDTAASTTTDDGMNTDAPADTGSSGEPPGSSEGDPGDEESSGSTGMVDAGPVEFFEGRSETFTPEGMSTGVDLILARRQMIPDDDQILETLYLIHPDGSTDRFDLVQDVDLAAQTFTSEFSTDFGNLRIDGEYTSGEDWAWDGWRSTSTYIDGVSAGWVVTSEDTRNDDGSHQADKEVYDARGQLFFVIEERLESIDQQTYEMAVAELE